MSKFKVGDRVVVKEWDEMVKEFGLILDFINCNLDFVPSMKHFCGETGTIIRFDNRGSGVDIDFDNSTLEKYYAFSTDMVRHIVEQQEDFTIDMLETGMRVETREGELYLVLKDCNTVYGDSHIVFANFNQDGFLCEEDYTIDLFEQSDMPEFDIMKVYAIDKKNVVFGTVLDPNKKHLIWERLEEDDCEGCDFRINDRCTIGDTEEDTSADLVLGIIKLGRMLGIIEDEDEEDDGTMPLDDFLDMLQFTSNGYEEKNKPITEDNVEEELKDMLWSMFLEFMDEEGIDKK